MTTQYKILDMVPESLQEEIAGYYEDGYSMNQIVRKVGRIESLRSRSKLINDRGIKMILDKYGVKTRKPSPGINRQRKLA